MDLGFLGMSGRNRQKDTKKQQALHRVLLGLLSKVLAFPAVGDCLGAMGLNGLLDLATRPRLVQVYLPASDACCPPSATCCPL